MKIKKISTHLQPLIAHLYYFSREAFKKMCEIYKFKLISSQYFYWTLPATYLFDSLQKLLFKKSLISIKNNLTIRVNLFDSLLYVLLKK
jgi:hypothetical protein